MPPVAGVRRRLILTVAGSAIVAGLLVHALAGRGDEFAAALEAAPLWLLGGVALLQVCALVARSEAWNVCVDAAGGSVSRRRLYRAAAMGYVGSLVNGQVGVAARIAALRRSAPRDSPPVGALVAAEVPILTVEAALAALTSFTLVGPLGLPWWSPGVALLAVVAVSAALGGVARLRRRSLWKGMSVMRSFSGQSRIVALVLVATFAQIARNWIVLHALGVNASLFDAIAVLIVMVTLSQLPFGPSVGAAATVAILGPQGLATAAAAGVLLTATGTAGSLLYAAWAGADRLAVARRARRVACGRRHGVASSARGDRQEEPDGDRVVHEGRRAGALQLRVGMPVPVQRPPDAGAL